MKAETAFVEPALEQLTAELIDLVREWKESEHSAEKFEQKAISAREASRMRALEIGKKLIHARAAWPERGPKAKGWGEFVAKIGIDLPRAFEWMKYAGFVAKSALGDETPAALPTFAEAGIRTAPVLHVVGPAASTGIDPAPAPSSIEPVANVHGGSGEPDRGAWCTPTWITEAVGRFNVDPFSNLRSTVHADVACMLERGDNGLVTADLGGEAGVWHSKTTGHGKATENTKVWLQPPYDIVLDVLAHYLHTRFCALLRFDPSTKWFAELHAASELILLTRKRVDFQPPRGVLEDGEKAAGAPFPHALFYARAEDATPAIRALCFEWTTNNQKAI